MKKCSKSHHHALAELNITPLLDLAFVLLVIFIITTTPIVNDLEIDLPSAARRMKDPKPKVTYVTVDRAGKLFLNKEPVDLPSLQEKVAALRVDDPDLSIVIRGSGHAKYGSAEPGRDGQDAGSATAEGAGGNRAATGRGARGSRSRRREPSGI